MKKTYLILLTYLLCSFNFFGQKGNNDTIMDSYAILRYSGGVFQSLIVTYDDKSPEDLKQILKLDNSPSKQIKGINSIGDEYVFEGFLYLNRHGYKLVTSTILNTDKIGLQREYIFIKITANSKQK